MRSRFDEQLSTLNRQLIEMGAACEEAITLAMDALKEGDKELAKQVAPLDAQIDRMERDIESLCLRLLLQQQPVARDLRLISSALKMITDMERVGDQAADIAEIIGHIKGSGQENIEDITRMASVATGMVTRSVDAFVKRDLSLAKQAIDADDIVDDLFLQVRDELIKLISDNPNEGGYALDLLMIAKYFERIGDHAVNIAQWVAFSVTGVHDEKYGGVYDAKITPERGDKL